MKIVTSSKSGMSSFLAKQLYGRATIINRLSSYLLIAPLVLVMLMFFGIPLGAIMVVSFMDFDGFSTIREFTWLNYTEFFESSLTWKLYYQTFRTALIVWLICLGIALTVSNFLVFHVKSLMVQIGLLLLCTIPFWTSSIIRMISWLPVLGRNGLINSSLMSVGIIDEPIDDLIYSNLAVVIVYVQSFSLFMIVPIFNSMVRISPDIVEAAKEAGASRWQVLTNIVIPLSKSGIALGTIFIIALVMGDFFIIRVMGGGQSSNVAMAISNQIGSFQYPPAAAASIIFLCVILLIISAMLRVVDVRKEVLS